MVPRFCRGVDAISHFFHRVASWCGLLLALLTVEQVVARYIFNRPSVALQELEWHLFGAIFLLGTAWTLRADGHVRVDIFYARASARCRALIDLLGLIFLLIPCCLIIAWHGWQYAVKARAYESGVEPDRLSAALAGKDGAFYPLLARSERLLRQTVLVGEISPDPGGLEARWLAKALVPLGFLLLALQGLALAFHKIALLRGLEAPETPQPPPEARHPPLEAP